MDTGNGNSQVPTLSEIASEKKRHFLLTGIICLILKLLHRVICITRKFDIPSQNSYYFKVYEDALSYFDPQKNEELAV